MNNIPILKVSGQRAVPILNPDGTVLFNTAAALADAASAAPTTSTVGTIPLLMNATTVDRQRAVVNGLNSTGTGIAAAGLVAQLDDTSPTSITENQFGTVRMDTNRFLYVGLGTLISGENQTTNRMMVAPTYTHTYVAAGQATTVIKSSPGLLHSVTFWAAAAATNVTTIYDHASGSGTIIGLPAATAVTFPTTVILDVSFTVGLTVITATANGSPMTFAWI